MPVKKKSVDAEVNVTGARVTIGCKANLQPVQYNNIETFVSISFDVEPDETLKQAIERGRKTLAPQLAEAVGENFKALGFKSPIR